MPDDLESRIVRLRSRRVPLTNFPVTDAVVHELISLPDGEELIDRLGLDRTETVICGQWPNDALLAVVVSGRLPESGAFEVLAGDLARLDSFTMDGQVFRVTGRMARGIPSLSFAYYLPSSPATDALFTNEAGGEPCWFHPNGLAEIDWTAPPFDTEEKTRLRGGQARTSARTALLTLLGLVAAAFGGVLFHYRIFLHLARRNIPFGALCREVARRPRLFLTVNAVLYGAFFAPACLAPVVPVANMRMNGLIASEFQEGSLSYVGEAYAGGDILKAGGATFLHNYGVATVLFTFLPSLFIPFAGAVKTMLSFALVGFAMAPIWTDMASGFAYHSITMVLELEAYIVASFAVIVLPVYVLLGLSKGPFGAHLLSGLRLFGSAMITTAVMLAVAAFYEAATLILLRGV